MGTRSAATSGPGTKRARARVKRELEARVAGELQAPVGIVEANIYHMIAFNKAKATGLCHLRGRLGGRVHFLVPVLRNGALGCLVTL